MSAAARNLVNLNLVSKSFSSRLVLEDISLGVNDNERIGIVGRNGDGKSTLLRLIAGKEEADSGQVTRVAGLNLAMVAQGDDLDPTKTIREELVGGRADHEWAGDSRFRSVLDGLLGGVEMSRFPQGLDTVIGPLSGGERRRIALAKLLLDTQDLLLLDEPTNHLDLEAVHWLASHLRQRRGSLVVITHDRWFLDEVVDQTWEVADRTVHQYEGGYAAYVLARAERDRQEATRDAKQRQLVKKELAWLRRGPPARTSKPKFRIEAANELIADVPEVRNSVELLRFATTRLGDKVIDAVDVSIAFGDRKLFSDTTWRLGPGDRLGLLGVNGSGKTTLIRLLTGDLQPDTGVVETGTTVRIALLSQDTAEIPGHLRVQESLREVRQSTTTSAGKEFTAGQLCERFGFRGARAGTLVKNLSGGERRRLQLMRLLMNEPNVLILDEPTNDLDIDTLTALEDLLDNWPGTLIVVSHDRYFIERVCDNVYAVGQAGLNHLPGGVEQYLNLRTAAAEFTPTSESSNGSKKTSTGGGAQRATRKELTRIERALAKLDARETELHKEMEAAVSDFELLATLNAELSELKSNRTNLETEWFELSDAISEN